MTLSLLNARHAPVSRDGDYVLTACRLRVAVRGAEAARYFAPDSSTVTCPLCLQALNADPGREPPA